MMIEQRRRALWLTWLGGGWSMAEHGRYNNATSIQSWHSENPGAGSARCGAKEALPCCPAFFPLLAFTSRTQFASGYGRYASTQRAGQRAFRGFEARRERVASKLRTSPNEAQAVENDQFLRLPATPRSIAVDASAPLQRDAETRCSIR